MRRRIAAPAAAAAQDPVYWVAGPQLAFDRGMAPYRGVSKRRSGRGVCAKDIAHVVTPTIITPFHAEAAPASEARR